MNTQSGADQVEGRLTRPKLDAILVALGERTGLDTAGSELIKFTNNAVFRLRHAPVVVRIAGSATMRKRAAKVVRMARWLADHNVPAVQLLPHFAQPIDVDGHLATLWVEVPLAGRDLTGADLGILLRRLHSITDSPPNLPRWNTLESIRSRLAEAEGLHARDHDFLAATADELEDALGKVTYHLATGVIHGDATVANLISGPGGPVICDFDSSSTGPREWDLTPVATGQFRFANSKNNHAVLAEAYGFDITRWEGFPILRRLRELQLVTSVVPVLRSNPSLREQWSHRLNTFRSGETGALWEAYR